MTDAPSLSITLLGAGQEVGRSCCVLKYRGRTVVCDAGVHPAYSGMASLPFVDELDWSSVDAILITHFHLDHAAALTYIMEKTNFRDGKGKVYMTHPTKAVYKFLMQDFVRMSAASADALFTPLDLTMSLASIVTVSAHQVISPCPGLTFTPYHAGHVLGACMYHIDIAGVRVLYTGDYSREEDRHLVKAEIPPIRPDVLIVESTYGVQSVGNRDEKEGRFLNLIHEVIKRGGHALMPVFALGRAQELLLVLDEYWAQHPELHSVPIYYASNLARKCMAVYQTYIHTMNANIRQRFARRDNPFIFKHISHLPQTRASERKIAEGPPCVVLASPGMLQSSTSRELLEMWAPDSRNALIITGYSVEGTLARDILNDPEEIQGLRGNTIPRRLSVHYISFSAHVDYAQNSEFIELIKAQHVVLVHGEQNNMGRLRAALQSRYKDRDEDIKIHTPRNLETLRLSFRGEKVAKAIGALALQPQQPGTVLSGLLVSKDYSYTLLQPHDLRDFAGLSTSSVTQRQRIAIGCGFELVKWHLQGMFGTVDDVVDEGGHRTLRVMGAVDVKHMKEFEVMLEWDSSASNDMIADSVLALILGIDASPASVKMTTHSHEHVHPHADVAEDEWEPLRARRIAKFLEAHFGNVELFMPDTDEKLAVDAYLIIRLDDFEAQVHVGTMTVTSENDAFRRRIESVLEMALATTTSLAHSYTAGYISEYPQERNEPGGAAKPDEGGDDGSDDDDNKPLEVIG